MKTQTTNQSFNKVVIKESAQTKGSFENIKNVINTAKSSKASHGFIQNIYYKIFKNSIILF